MSAFTRMKKCKEGRSRMKYQYQVTGAERKALVQAICEVLGVEASYQGAPSFAYEMAGYAVDKDGALSCHGDVSTENAEQLVTVLRERGFEPLPQAETMDVPDTIAENATEEAPDNIVIEVPKDDFTDTALVNLEKLIASKATLLKKVLDTDDLAVERGDETLRFPWFTRKGLEEEAEVYAQLVQALCAMAKQQKRVVATDKPVENEKFAFRVFLIRLGFVGPEYKNARKFLLMNLEGNSAFKSGSRPVKPVVGSLCERPDEQGGTGAEESSSHDTPVRDGEA
jgi:hypothetical protein